MPMPSAPSEIIAIDGVHRMPMLGPVTRTIAISTGSASGHGSSAIATPDAPTPIRHGSTRPWRSEMRPKYGLIVASSAPAATNVAPIPAADAPSSSSRSGGSTSSVPNISPTRITIHMPVAIRGSLTPAKTARIGVRAGTWVEGVSSAQTSRPPATAPTPVNTTSVPRVAEAAPSTGPSSAPTIAAPIAEPITSPRRSRGAAPTSQPSAPAHEAAEPSPWTKRATSSTTMLLANANAIEEAISRLSPTTTVARTPSLAATQPPGSEPSRVPAGYAAARTPAPVLLRPNSSTNPGSSGTIAAKNIASMKTMAEASASRRRSTPPTLRGGGAAVPRPHAAGEHAAAHQQREERAGRDEHAGVGGRQRVEPPAEVDDRGAQRDRADDGRPREAPQRHGGGAGDVADEAVRHDRDQPRGEQTGPAAALAQPRALLQPLLPHESQQQRPPGAAADRVGRER